MYIYIYTKSAASSMLLQSIEIHFLLEMSMDLILLKLNFLESIFSTISIFLDFMKLFGQFHCHW